MESDALLFSNGGVCEDFAADKHYVGATHNHLTLSFCVTIDCHEGYLILVRVGDEEHPNPI